MSVAPISMTPLSRPALKARQPSQQITPQLRLCIQWMLQNSRAGLEKRTQIMRSFTQQVSTKQQSFQKQSSAKHGITNCFFAQARSLLIWCLSGIRALVIPGYYDITDEDIKNAQNYQDFIQQLHPLCDDLISAFDEIIACIKDPNERDTWSESVATFNEKYTAFYKFFNESISSCPVRLKYCFKQLEQTVLCLHKHITALEEFQNPSL